MPRASKYTLKNEVSFHTSQAAGYRSQGSSMIRDSLCLLTAHTFCLFYKFAPISNDLGWTVRSFLRADFMHSSQTFDSVLGL